MSKQSKKKKPAISREAEIESAKLFGKHLSKQKRTILLFTTLIACAMPAVMGIRLWGDIPALVSTGLIGMNGKDDSLPRWVIALGLPGLMCILDAICHLQLWVHQDKMKLPPIQVRLLGRWGFPVISVLFCSGMIRQAVGLSPLTVTFASICVMGLLMLLLGSHMWECPRNAKVALRFSFTEQSEPAWDRVHRVAGGSWMLTGLLTILSAMIYDRPVIGIAVLVVFGLLFPFFYGFAQKKDNTLL